VSPSLPSSDCRRALRLGVQPRLLAARHLGTASGRDVMILRARSGGRWPRLGPWDPARRRSSPSRPPPAT
jgi:hypothetical protein